MVSETICVTFTPKCDTFRPPRVGPTAPRERSEIRIPTRFSVLLNVKHPCKEELLAFRPLGPSANKLRPTGVGRILMSLRYTLGRTGQTSGAIKTAAPHQLEYVDALKNATTIFF